MTQAPEVRRGGNLPFGMVASRWMCDPRYSANARTLYAILVSYADTQGRDTAQGKPFRKELAAQLGVHLSTLDRTIDELEVAGLIAVERRGRIDRAGVNDANLYHLNDAGVMWQGNGTWIDPLPPGKAAAEVVKERTEKRRRAKREAGITRKGGVAKGVNTRAVHASSSSAENHSDDRIANGQPEGPAAETSEGGSSTHAATGGSTHAAGVAAPVLPFIKNPVQNPSPEAPSARSAADARRASHQGEGPARESGGAASDTTTQTEKPRSRRTPLLRTDVARVLAAYPGDLTQAVEATAGSRAPRALITAIRVQLAERTADQLAHRVARRWHAHGHAARHADGTMDRPVGVAVALIRAGECGHARCEDGTDLDTGTPCRSCAERRRDRDTNRRSQERTGHGTAQTTAQPAAEAAATEPERRINGLCPGCRLPGTGGKHCTACLHRASADRDDAPPARAAPPRPTVIAPRSSDEQLRPRCTRCRTRTGRDRWGGLCGPCQTDGRPASDTSESPS
ncbi:hypothetical protein LO772_16435 [Yinghuangia sp. ASG 101]|uniref:hypothetical protein n=1 Tax=Yinghuangia sp. ASG 101 TaxID=2896848 RepID=UPI001E58B19E|nr:hypothetical protein [Yinghuangia sp. ASG 101]UGQ15013.1 hypothetical protein LO772_16435 [Yinghuangia sp. ASG 101]